MKPIQLAILGLLSTALAAQGPAGPGRPGPRPAPTPATSATFTNFGTACGADLNGSVSATLNLSLDVTNAAPGALVFVGMGQPLATPRPLPLGTCSILVDHLRLWGHFVGQTDANGAYTQTFNRVPPAGLNVSFQAVVMTFDRTTQTRTMDASNGTTLVTQ